MKIQIVIDGVAQTRTAHFDTTSRDNLLLLIGALFECYKGDHFLLTVSWAGVAASQLFESGLLEDGAAFESSLPATIQAFEEWARNQYAWRSILA